MKIQSCFCLLFCGALALSLSACQKGKKSEEGPDYSKIYTMKIDGVDQYSTINTEKADGKYVIVRLNIKNLTVKEWPLSAGSFTLRHVSTKPDEQYELSPRKANQTTLSKLAGMEEFKVMGKKDPLLPKMSLKRAMLFELPDEANLSEFAVCFQAGKKEGGGPQGGFLAGGGDKGPTGPARCSIKLPLAKAQYKVNDYR